MAKKEPKHEPSSKNQAARTAANKQANVARDLKQKAEKAARKQAQIERRRAEFDAWQADIARRGAKVVALPVKDARAPFLRERQVFHHIGS